MLLTVEEIAKRVGGVLEGGGSAPIKGVASVQEAAEGDITFLTNPKYAAAVESTRASAIIVNQTWAGKAPCAVIKVRNADMAFMQAAMLLAPKAPAFKPGVHPTAVVAAGAEVAGDASIGPYCVIEEGASIGARSVLCAFCYVGHGAVLGSDCRLMPHVSLREHVRIGDRVILHNGTVIGSDGFGYYKEGVEWKKIPQVGIVEIGNDVEIGANVTVDRARFGKTIIGNGVKIDNLVQIAHNVRVGDNTAMAAQVGVSGSTVIGSNVQLGGQAGLAGHLKVGDNSVVGAQAGVTKNVPPATFVSGYPAMQHKQALETHAHLMRLPVLKKKVDVLQKRVDQLDGKTDAAAPEAAAEGNG